MEYGILVYDVPVKRRNVYNKLRDRIRRFSIQLTWSVYMTPFSRRDDALSVLKELDESEDTNHRIMYRYIKFDSSENEELDRTVREEFQKQIQRVKDDLHQKLGEAEREYEDDLKDKALVQRGHLSKALKKIREARRLATVFEVTDFMEAAFEAFEKMAEARREKIKDELKVEKEKQEAEAKAASAGA